MIPPHSAVTGMNKDLNIKLTADTTQASTALKNISTQVDAIARSHTGIQGVASSLAIVASGAKVALTPMRLLAQASIECSKAYIASARQSITMEASVRALGSACAVTVKDILNIADSLATATAGDDDAIVGVEQFLLSVKTLDREGLERATEAALDMSVALGTDAKNAASSLARALADPADNMRALRSANIQFNDSEEEQIKKLQESGKLWDAQQIILEKVEKTYGGMAKAVGDTDVGKLDRIAGAMGDLRESLGGALANAISPYLDNIYDSIVRIQNWIDEHNAATSLSMALQNGGSPCSAEGNRLGRPVHHQPLSQSCRTQGSDQGRDLLRVSHPVPSDGFTPAVGWLLGIGKGNLQVFGGLGIDMSGTTSLSIGVLWTW